MLLPWREPSARANPGRDEHALWKENRGIHNINGGIKVTEAVLARTEAMLSLQWPDMTALAERALTWSLESGAWTLNQVVDIVYDGRGV
jgi:hypothetical protein